MRSPSFLHSYLGGRLFGHGSDPTPSGCSWWWRNQEKPLDWIHLRIREGIVSLWLTAYGSFRKTNLWVGIWVSKIDSAKLIFFLSPTDIFRDLLNKHALWVGFSGCHQNMYMIIPIVHVTESNFYRVIRHP